MTEKRFKHSEQKNDDGEYEYYGIEDVKQGFVYNVIDCYDVSEKKLIALLNELVEENEQLKTKNNAYLQDIEVFKEENTSLKLYKKAVSDVLLSFSQKNLTAKQLQVVIGIMEELNIKGDFE